MAVSIADPVVTKTQVRFRVTGLGTTDAHFYIVVDVATGKQLSFFERLPDRGVGPATQTLDLAPRLTGLPPGRYELQIYTDANFLQTHGVPKAGAAPESAKSFQFLSGSAAAAAPPAPSVRLERSTAESTADEVLWDVILAWTTGRLFNAYHAHIDQTLCRPSTNVFGPNAYQELVLQTRTFLEISVPLLVDQQKLFEAYTDKDGNIPYIGGVIQRYPDAVSGDPCSDINAAILQDPFPVELIWSYWHEEGALVQTLNHILARFQNRRPGRGVDPLARFDLNPLRPLRHILWSWAENEFARLTVRRRAAEYEYEYGLALVGSAIPGSGLWAERRVKFLEAFHTLLYVCHKFFLQDDDTTVQADAFPVLNALRETHLVLSEGAHNQFGDLPTEARVQMLVMQWLLAQPEMRDFLGGRPMVPYEEPWMDRVDTMKTIQGWTDTSVTHFRDLGVYGEQLLLSIRYGNWNNVIDPASAKNWARKWRPQIQRYVHSYRAATGVDLTARADATMPAGLLARRVTAQRKRA
jgi:hypothetical protein